MTRFSRKRYSRALKERQINVFTTWKGNFFHSFIFTFSCGIKIFLWEHNHSLCHTFGHNFLIQDNFHRKNFRLENRAGRC